MKKQNKMIMILLALVLVMSMIVGCTGKAPTTTTVAPTTTEAAATEAATTAAPEEDEPVKVALILEGAISDMSWNATAYNGLMKIKDMGAEVKYVENVAAAQVADSIRSFGDEGYDVIFLATSSYADAGKEVASEYPDTQFFLINAAVILDNMSSFVIQDAEQGFMMGALAALLSKTGTVGFVGGTPINPILEGAKGFAQGAKYVNPDITVLSENTGNFDNVNAAKELAKTFAGQGADVLAPMANQASLGVMEAAEEEGVWCIGSGLNQEKQAPTKAVVAIVKDTAIAYEAAYKAYLAGEISDQALPMGAQQGVVYIGEYYVEVPEEVKTELAAIYEKLASGEIKIALD